MRLKTCLPLGLLSGVVVVAVAGAFMGSTGGAEADGHGDLSLFASVLRLVRRHYVEPMDERRLLRGAVRGMLAELDPHSSFLDSDALEVLREDAKGEFHGLGLEIIKRDDGLIEVVSPIEGTQAAHAGIRARDQIVSICPTDPPQDWSEECRSSASMTLFEAVRLLRGPEGSKITIQLLREGFGRPRAYPIVRGVVKVVLVEGRMLEPGYAYVRLRAFQEDTIRDLERTLGRLHENADGPFEGLVLDIRDNPGGLIDQAVDVADSWLTDGLIVYTKGRVDSQRQEFRAYREGTEPGYPIVVLVNEGTASASEIVAGALQDHHRALLVGEKTFGKGSVQTVYPLEGGTGLRLTTAFYFTPSGRSIHEVGIAPDIAVEPAPASEASKGPTASRRRRRDRGFEERKDVDPRSGSEPEAPEAQPPAESDIQLERALEALKSWTYFERLKEGQEASAPRLGPRLDKWP